MVIPSLPVAIWAYALGLTLAYVALVDLRRFSIPTWGVVALATQAGVAVAADPQTDAKLARLATGAVLALLFEVLRRLVRRGGRPGLGEGDVMLAGVLGVLVNWRLAAPVVCLAALAPLGIQLARRKFGPTPLGFWLSISSGLFLALVAVNAAPQ
jgi:hypothetical protein